MRSAAVNCVFHCNMTCCDGRYSDGHIYIGHWRKSQRSGFGRLEETSRRNSLYTGSWEMDKRNGYGVYEDKMRYVHYYSSVKYFNETTLFVNAQA